MINWISVMLDCHNLMFHQLPKPSLFSSFPFYSIKKRNLGLRSLKKKNLQRAPKTFPSFYSPLILAISQTGKML